MKLYPGHQHQWADYNPHRVGLYTSMVRCTVCGFQAPRNAAGLDGGRVKVWSFPQIENGIAYTAAELDAALTADEATQPEQETPA